MAANRDEFYAREALQAHWWNGVAPLPRAGSSHSPVEGVRVFGGRDVEAHGTWLAVADNGRVGAVTNWTEDRSAPKAPGSRGDLPRGFLFGDCSAEDFVATIEGPRYAGFNFLAYDGDELLYTSNRTGEVRTLKPGVYGLTNTRLGPGSIRGKRHPEVGHPHSFDEWPKAVFGAAALERIAGTASTDDLIDLLSQAHVPLETPADRELAPERSYSPCFIHGAEYGTRASTAVIVGNGSIEFAEQAYGPFGEPGSRASATIPIAPPSHTAKETPWT